jgi:S-(hydroxymethyl)glutathione dehydrogenase/alcohol dehydrogenase
MKTLAAVLIQLNKPLEILELEIPPLKKGQVLVQMAFSGLCHTQLNEWKGIKGPDAYLPHTFGHEGSGKVLEVGEGVTKVKPGDHVVASWIKGIGLDVPGTTYRNGQQSVNSGAISTFLEKAIISENRLVPISQKIPLKEAALLGCAIPTGAGVLFNDMQIKEGQSIAVFGVGGIGSSALLAARHAKAFPIVAVDVHEEKLQKAKELGATHTISARDPALLSKLSEIFNGKGADFALEAAGKREAMEMAFECIKAPGGFCVLAGNLPAGERIQIDPFSLIRGKKIMGTWGGGSRIDHDIPRFAEIFLGKANTLHPLISQVVPLAEINELMESLNQGRIARGLVVFPSDQREFHA